MSICYNCIIRDKNEGFYLANERTWKQFLAHPLLEGTDSSLPERLRSEGEIFFRPVAAGERLLTAPAETPTAGILLAGRAAILTADPGRSVLLRYLSPGDPFGIANLFTKEPLVSVIRAETACSACYLTEDAVRTLLSESPAFRERYVGFLGGRIRFLNRKISYLTAGSAERRLALYLLSFGESEIRLRTSLSSLSELLDVGRASLYRAFDRLEADEDMKTLPKDLFR